MIHTRFGSLTTSAGTRAGPVLSFAARGGALQAAVMLIVQGSTFSGGAQPPRAQRLAAWRGLCQAHKAHERDTVAHT